MRDDFSMKSLATVSIFIVALLASNMAALCSAQAQNQLSVALQVSYDNGYTLATGTVTDAGHNPVEGATVSIQAVDSTGKTVHFQLTYTDKNGIFSDKFKTPDGTTGDGNIFVSASKTGYDNGNAQSVFTTVPEFSTALTAIVTSISLALLILRKRRG